MNVSGSNSKWCWTVQERTYGGGHAQRFFLPKNWTPDASAFSAFWRESSHMHCVRCCNKAALKKIDFDTSAISFGISFMKKKSMTSKGFLGKVCQKCRNLWVVDFLRENSWKRPELTLRLWIQKCHNNFRQVFNFANLAHGTSGTRDTNMYKNDVQTAKIRECRCPYFWIQRLTLLCHKTAAAIGRHTVHISSSLNLKKLISICIVCIPPVPLVLPLILHCHHVSSCLQLKCSPKANACDWGSMMQSSGLKSSPQTESWNFGDRNQSHFMNSIQFRSTLDIFAAVSASLVLLKLTLIRKHKAVLCLTRIYVFLVVLSIVREIQRNVQYHQILLLYVLILLVYIDIWTFHVMTYDCYDMISLHIPSSKTSS